MRIKDDIEDRINEYGGAFDYYLQHNELPDFIPEDDVLGNVIVKVFDENPQLDGHDPLWVDVFKTELMKFFAAIMELLIPIEKDFEQEMILISAFSSGDIDFKRKMWNTVYGTIKKNYTRIDVNIDDYIEQMKENSGQVSPILSALAKDWKKACEKKMKEAKQELIERSQRKIESNLKNYGTNDYTERKKIERIFYNYPKLQRIVEIIGREQPPKEKVFDDTIRYYLPLLPSPPAPAAEVEEIAQGNNLRYILPIEMTVMADKETEDLFLLKYATRQLQLFANRPKEESRKKREQHKKDKPRMEKGPIIVSIDTSGSMEGRQIKVATSLLLQLLNMAKKQNRKCYLIEFSIRANCLDLCSTNAWSQLERFLENRFSGGTDGEEMLGAALEMLNTKAYSMADVLIISDFYFAPPTPETLKMMEDERKKGTRFYGLHINSWSYTYNDILDNIWDVKF